MYDHRILLQNEAQTPLGRLRLAGHILDGIGVERSPPLRVYGAYAVMGVLRGAGQYRDSDGLRVPITAGDVIVVLPEHAHWYGPPRGRTWEEIYLTFDGPAFDLWRQAGIFDPAHLVYRAPEGWLDRLHAFIEKAASVSGRGMRQITSLQTLLAELLLPEDEGSNGEGEESAAPSDWLARAKGVLDIDVGRDLDLGTVAAEAGMSYETFRKRFRQAMGVSPAHYRAQRRIEAARELLRYAPGMTNRQIGEALGFADEYHFSRRFTQIAGMTPRAFRRSGANEGIRLPDDSGMDTL